MFFRRKRKDRKKIELKPDTIKKIRGCLSILIVAMIIGLAIVGRFLIRHEGSVDSLKSNGIELGVFLAIVIVSIGGCVGSFMVCPKQGKEKDVEE